MDAVAASRPSGAPVATPPAGGGPGYKPPDWAGPAGLSEDPVAEVIAQGDVKLRVPLAATAGRSEASKPTAWSFLLGRAPECDVCLGRLEPKASRHHCMLQARDGRPELYVYDLGSAHGTLLNGRQIDPHTFTPVRVGDQLRCCAEGSRCSILISGPEDAMQEEGEVDLSAFRAAAALEKQQMQKQMQEDLQRRKDAKRKRMQVDAQRSAVVNALAARSLNKMKELNEAKERHREKLHEVTWGMGDDAVEPVGDDSVAEEAQQLMDSADRIDVEKVRNSRELTDKQQQLLDKVDQKQRRIANLLREKEKWEMKLNGSDQGQKKRRTEMSEDFFDDDRGPGPEKKSNALEQLQRVSEKLEVAEEGLREASRNVFLSFGLTSPATLRPSKERAAMFDTGICDDGDDFYDRTAVGRGAVAKRAASAGDEPTELIGLPAIVGVQTKESLESTHALLEAERARLNAQLATEKLKEAQRRRASSDVGAAAEEEDELDAFMGATLAELRHDRTSKVQARLAAVEERLREVKAMHAMAIRNTNAGTGKPQRQSEQPECGQGKDADGRAEKPERCPPKGKEAKHERAALGSISATLERSRKLDALESAEGDADRAEDSSLDGAERQEKGQSPATGSEAAATQPGVAGGVPGAQPQGPAPAQVQGSRPPKGEEHEKLDAASLAGKDVRMPPRRPAPMRGLINPDQAGIQLIGNLPRGAPGAAAMPPPRAPAKKKVYGPSMPPPMLPSASRDAGLAASGEEEL